MSGATPSGFGKSYLRPRYTTSSSSRCGLRMDSEAPLMQVVMRVSELLKQVTTV
jgi:hypothetical protein